MRIAAFLLTPVLLLAIAVPAAAQEAPPIGPPAEGPRDEMDKLKERIAQQEEFIKKLTRELEEAKKVLEKIGKQKTAQAEPSEKPEPAEQPQTRPEPLLEGQITRVRMDNKIVLLNLGSDTDIKGGDLFAVYRAGRKVGKIKVCKVVDKDMSNAEILESEIDLIQGDRVVQIAGATEAPPVAEPVAREPEQAKVEEPHATGMEKLSRRLDVLEGLYADLTKQVERLQAKLEGNKKVAAEEAVRKSAPRAEPDRVERPAELKAKIVAVSDKFVFIGVGVEHGVKEGDTFVIKRGEREVATVKVTTLIEDMCKAEIVSKNTEIRQRGDIAILQ